MHARIRGDVGLGEKTARIPNYGIILSDNAQSKVRYQIEDKYPDFEYRHT
jgi:hypothetical protein